MENWTPLTVLWVSCIASAATNIGAQLLTKKPVTIRTIVGTILFHGPMGGGFATVLYDSFAWARKPTTALFFAIAYGGGAIKLPDIRTIALRILGHDQP